MMYADFAYYSGNYGGSLIPENDFDHYSAKASDRIDAVTFGRLENGIPDEFSEKVKRCTCELAEIIYIYSTISKSSVSAENSSISSEKIGEYSVQYTSSADRISAQFSSYRDFDGICNDTIRRHLSRTGLLYRGVYE